MAGVKEWPEISLNKKKSKNVIVKVRNINIPMEAVKLLKECNAHLIYKLLLM